MVDRATLRAEIAENYDFLMRTLATVLPERAGQYALMRDRNILGFYKDAYDADVAGHTLTKDGRYSIQQVTDELMELGVYSHAVG